MTQRRDLEIPTARAFVPLLDPARYKGAYGGRGSGKSHFFAELMVEECLRTPGLLCICVREIQKSLMDSAKRLIESKLAKHDLGEWAGFRVYNDRIRTPGDGVIAFQGMQDHTADSIKSLEGFDRAWVEEAQSLSERSLTLLRPTIRKDGSELWFSWNPRFKTDPVDALLRGDEPPTGAAVVRANWSENPWFPAVLEQERQDCLRTTPDQYAHIWNGDYVTVVKGAYYSVQLAMAREEGRIGRVTADPVLSLHAHIDIGGTGARSDAFAMWITQWVGREIRVLDHYEAVGQEAGAHIAWLRERGYSPGRLQVWLPHDGDTQDRVFAVSYRSVFQKAGYPVTVVENQGRGAAASRIAATRLRFPMCLFNEATTEAGRQALGWYHEKWDELRNVGLGPDHDWSSHAADAFGMMCSTYREPSVGSAGKSEEYAVLSW